MVTMQQSLALRRVAGRGLAWRQQQQQVREAHSLTLDNLSPRLKEMQYAVRGAVPIAAGKIAAEIAAAKRKGEASPYPFDEVLFCNIGNPQAVRQPPLSYYRNVSSLVDCPRLLESDVRGKARELFEEHELERAEEMVAMIGSGGSGAYSDSQGVLGIREHVCDFIKARDGYAAEPSNLFLTNGASTGIQHLMTAMLAEPTDAVMIPIPQYPIYSALISLLGGQQAGYFMNEDEGWALEESELQRSFDESCSRGHRPRAMAIINPGNPTGSVLTYSDLETVVRFCHRNKLVLMADEVYQENCYNPEQRPFVSAKKVVCDLDLPVELASFHSTSKGFIGECGRRGGYMELHNFDPEVHAQIVKLASASLCSNLNGQIMTGLMVRPPSEGPTKARFEQERDTILGNLKRKSAMVFEALNDVPGVSCQPLDGAMYAFPRIELPESFVRAAEAEGEAPDARYAMSLLRETGICAVPGSGFRQVEGTHHLRMTFLPEEEPLKRALERFRDHHLKITSS